MNRKSNIHLFPENSGSITARWIFHFAVFVLLACFALSAFTQAPQTADSATSSSSTSAPAISGTGPYGVDITFGYASYQADLKAGVWYPVWAAIEARKADLEGEITLQQPRNQLAITIPIQVAKGTRKRYMSYYQLDTSANPELNIEIHFKNFKGDAFKQPILFAEETEQHILALTDEPGSLAALSRLGIDTLQDPASEEPQQQQRPMRPRRTRTSSTMLGGTKVIYGAPELLPEDPIALDGIDGMVINTRRVRALNKRQWDALGAWVAQGGRLLLAGGKNQPFIEQSVAKGAFGITLTPALPAPMTGNPGSGASESLLASWPTGGWTRLALGDAQHPLIAGKPVGRGWFYTCAVALDAEALKLIARRDDSGRLWPELLERHQGGTPLEQIAQEDVMLIGADLQRPFSVNLAGTSWVLGFLGIYIVLVLPVNWFICGRLKRREWAWPVAIAIALAFTWYGYNSGLRSQSSVFQVNELSFVLHPAGAAQARAVTFSAVFSPRRYRTDLQAGIGVFANRLNRVSQSQNQYSYYYDQGDLYSDRNLDLVFSPASVWLGDFFFHPWSARNLRSDFTLPMNGGVEALTPLELETKRDSMPNGEIVNRTPWHFKRWWISNGLNVWEGRKPLGKMTSATLERELSPVAYDTNPATLRQLNQNMRMGELSCCADIVRSAIARKFFNQQGLQNSTDMNEIQRRNMLLQAMTPRQAWLATNRKTALGKELFFIGEAETSATPSPMLEHLKLEKRTGVLLYEAALPLGTPGTQATPSPTRWTPMLLDSQAVTGNFYDPYNQGPLAPYAGGAGEIIIRAESTDVQLVPDQPVRSGLDGPLTITLKVENFPDKELGFIAEKDRTTGADRDPITGRLQHPPGQEKANNPPEYVIAGCPVLVYNKRLDRLEKTRIMEDGHVTVTPARDYLLPGSSALLLRIEAVLPNMIFKTKQGGQHILNAREILGKQADTLSLNNYAYGYSNNRFSFQVKIKDISVTLGDATTTSTLERRAQ